MNALMQEIFSTVIPSAPYLIAAYVLVLVVLFVFVGITLKRVKKAEKQLQLLEEEFDIAHQ